jgi:hypothetical protein
VVVQAASAQTSSVISMKGNAWTRLVAQGGLSATAVFQALLSSRVARAIETAHPQCRFINASFPGCRQRHAGGLAAARAVRRRQRRHPVERLRGRTRLSRGWAHQVLAHYQNLAPWRREPESRDGLPPRVWIDGHEVADVYDRFKRVKLTPEPAIDISGGSGVPLLLALAADEDWQGHVPGPDGLPGGYPVVLRGGALALDLPPGLDRDEAIGWNRRYEHENGLVVESDGRVHYTGRLHEALSG